MSMSKPCVYRYIDTTDNVVKYVGIVHKSKLEKRLLAHANNDKWALNGCWKVEYFECENRSEAEAFESHLIALYGTHKYYNKAKADWGINKYLPDVESWWKTAQLPKFNDIGMLHFSIIVRKLIRQNMRKETLFMLDLLEIEDN